jgi:hypothetical protein
MVGGIYCTNTTKSSLDFERDRFDQLFISSRVLVTRDGPKISSSATTFWYFYCPWAEENKLEDFFQEISLQSSFVTRDLVRNLFTSRVSVTRD